MYIMELGLSLGASKSFTFMEKPPQLQENNQPVDLGLNTTLSIGPIISTSKSDDYDDDDEEEEDRKEAKKEIKEDDHHNNIFSSAATASLSSSSSRLHHLLQPVPLSSFSWPPPENCDEVGGNNSVRGLKVKTKAEEEESEERTVLSSSPMSGASSFQVDLCKYNTNNNKSGNYYSSSNRKRKLLMMNNESEGDDQGNYNYYDEDDGNNGGVRGGGTRKKLRLSKEQSAFLEESFKEHSTLNPKQKLALAKQLNLRPRQVEVWFQNRRARTKLKQTEVDCEYLKRCCETLSEENKRLQKELQELRALKASNSNPFFMQLPATTLTMCPSCERVAPNNSSSNNNNNNNSPPPSKPVVPFPFAKPKFYPFPHSKPHQS